VKIRRCQRCSRCTVILAWPSARAPARPSERRVALTVVAVFLVTGIAWVLGTDMLLYAFTRDPVVIARLETAKGWVFVFLAALLLYVVTFRSAARLRRAHATFSAVVDSIADGVLLLGRDRAVVHANPAAIRMLRAENLGDLVGMGAPEFSRRFLVSYPDGCLVPPHRFISQRVFDEGGPLNYKAVLHPPGGDELVVSATAAAVRTEVGETPETVVSVMHDITDTEHLESMRNQFFAAAAHALKTPVAVLKGNAQLLSSHVEPRLARLTAAIERQCGRIDRLVQNLLILSRLRSGTLKLYPAELDLAPVVEDVAREMAQASSEHYVRAELMTRPRVHADCERLSMVLRNMIDDASRSAEPSTPLTVLLTESDSDAEIGVRFQPLSPHAGASAAVADCDDLGVRRYVTAAIVEAHGGALREASDGEKTTTWVRLPAVERAHGSA
jgi:signal transduction histidine kinase